MAWVKRNLYFVICCVIAVVLLGAAGWYGYSGWQGNSDSWELLKQAYSQLQSLGQKPVTPNEDNIKAAREEAKQAQDLSKGLRQRLSPIPFIPNTNKVDDHALATAVRDTITRLTASAAANHVEIPPDFSFSFSAQREKTAYAPQSLDQLARELGEIKAICDILFSNRINSLTGIERERTADDAAGGAMPEYLEMASITNNNTIITPYQVTFLSFDQELAHVLDGFANQQYGILVRTLEVEPAGMSPEGGMPQMGNQYPQYPGRPGGGYYPPQNTYSTTPGTVTPGGMPVVVDEKKLQITMLLELVRILPTPGR
jgi:hypothetical protein